MTSRLPVATRLRLAAFLAIFAFMVAGPFYRQVLGGGNEYLRQWVMFAGIAVGVVDATFFERLPDGGDREIDRYAVLGHPASRQAPESLWRIRGRRNTWQVARQLCDALGPDADVRVISREATRTGWASGYRGLANLCIAPAPAERDAASEDR